MAGVGLRSFVATPYVAVCAGLLVGCAVFTLGVSGQNRSRIIYGAIIASFFIGMLRFDVAARPNPDVASLIGTSTTVRGVVWLEPTFGPQSQTLHVRVLSVDNLGVAAPLIVRAVNKRHPVYEIGEELILSGRITDPTDDANFRNNTPAQPPVMLFPRIKTTNAPNRRPIMHALVRLKQTFGKSIDAALPEPHGAFLKGLLLGERTSLPADLLESFKETGTAHIVALSGYNITIIGRSLAWILMMLTIPFYASFWVACSAMALFVLMTGASASAVRAGIIAVLALIAYREGRPYQMTNALAFAGAAMLVFDPTLLRFDVGFQLSFLATMGLVYLAPLLEPRIEHASDRLKRFVGVRPVSRALWHGNSETTPRVFLTVKRLFIETLSAELAVLPLLVYLFGYLSLISPFANIAVLIAVPYAMGTGFFTGLAGFFSSVLGSIVGVASWILLEYIMDAVKVFASFPYATVELGRSGVSLILRIYGAAAWRIYRKTL